MLHHEEIWHELFFFHLEVSRSRSLERRTIESLPFYAEDGTLLICTCTLYAEQLFLFLIGWQFFADLSSSREETQEKMYL